MFLVSATLPPPYDEIHENVSDLVIPSVVYRVLRERVDCLLECLSEGRRGSGSQRRMSRGCENMDTEDDHMTEDIRGQARQIQRCFQESSQLYPEVHRRIRISHEAGGSHFQRLSGVVGDLETSENVGSSVVYEAVRDRIDLFLDA